METRDAPDPAADQRHHHLARRRSPRPRRTAPCPPPGHPQRRASLARSRRLAPPTPRRVRRRFRRDQPPRPLRLRARQRVPTQGETIHDMNVARATGPCLQPTLMLDPRLHNLVAAHPYPLVFATVSGAHLYGFPSADSDYDLRGVHVLPPREVLGLDVRHETLERSVVDAGLELDLVTHDARKFFLLLLRTNGYALEHPLSPPVARTTPAHQQLKSLAPACITRFHAYHSLGFAETQWRLFEKENPRRAKPLLYVYRVLLTGIHLMRTGEIQANLVTLNETHKLPYVPDLIARKLAGGEHSTLNDADLEFHRGEYFRLREQLSLARDLGGLPESPTARPALNDLLLRLRLEFAA